MEEDTVCTLSDTTGKRRNCVTTSRIPMRALRLHWCRVIGEQSGEKHKRPRRPQRGQPWSGRLLEKKICQNLFFPPRESADQNLRLSRQTFSLSSVLRSVKIISPKYGGNAFSCPPLSVL